MAIFRPNTFAPLAIIAKEISNSAEFTVKGELKKCKIAAREARGKLVVKYPGLLQQHGYDQGAGIVVGCIAFLAVGHGKDGVLQNTSVVRHVSQMGQVQSGQFIGRSGCKSILQGRPWPKNAFSTRPLEA